MNIMSDTLIERIAKSKAYTAKLEQQRRIQLRKEREAKKKKDQRRNYIIGELISKYFPEVLKLELGTKAENAITFEPLEVFLSILSNDKILMKRLKKAAKYTILNTRKNENFSDGKRSNV